MKLQTLSGVDEAIGGRPKSQSPKQRHSFYLNAKESAFLKEYAQQNDITVSELVRILLQRFFKRKV